MLARPLALDESRTPFSVRLPLAGGRESETPHSLGLMPSIARFGGVVVMIYFGDHPPPHVHARVGRPSTKGAAEARFSIDSGELIDGALPAQQASEVTRWCQRNRAGLLTDWGRAQADLHPVGRYD